MGSCQKLLGAKKSTSPNSSQKYSPKTNLNGGTSSSGGPRFFLFISRKIYKHCLLSPIFDRKANYLVTSIDRSNNRINFPAPTNALFCHFRNQEIVLQLLTIYILSSISQENKKSSRAKPNHIIIAYIRPTRNT